MKKFYFLILFSCMAFFISAQQTKNDSISKNFSYYGGKGFEFKDNSGNHLMHMEWRVQFRTAFPTDGNYLNPTMPEETIYLGIRRARMKVGGHSFSPKLKYYLEYELFRASLLDFRIMYEASPALKFKIGQWKVQYHRERIISSGKQQAVDRSILTPAFTVDRQQGVSMYGNLAGEKMANFNYWISAFMGNGRGSTTTSDPYLMYMTRLQWNPNGKELAFSGSDLEYHEKLRMLFAVAALTNRSEFTRFSTSGGGQLEGFDTGAPGQYQINQLLQESAGKLKGFSWQQELHFKQINDKLSEITTDMLGNLVQVGYFPSHIWKKFPKKMEIFGRHAFYLPDAGNNNNVKKELTLGGNWFFAGHRLKITGEASYLDSNYESAEIYYGWRYRLQLDISL
jgi:phosphate-selective porin OprO/OprP